MPEETLTIGKSEIRKDAWEKITGAAQSAADIPIDRFSHRSSHCQWILQCDRDPGDFAAHHA